MRLVQARRRSGGEISPLARLRPGCGQRRGRQLPMRPAIGCREPAEVAEAAIQRDCGNRDSGGSLHQVGAGCSQAPRIYPLEWRLRVARQHQLLQCSPADARHCAQLVERDAFAEMHVQPFLQPLDSLQTSGRGSPSARLLNHQPSDPRCDFRLESFDVAVDAPGKGAFRRREHPVINGAERRQAPGVDRKSRPISAVEALNDLASVRRSHGRADRDRLAAPESRLQARVPSIHCQVR